jgi:hypothetical protein
VAREPFWSGTGGAPWGATQAEKIAGDWLLPTLDKLMIIWSNPTVLGLTHALQHPRGDQASSTQLLRADVQHLVPVAFQLSGEGDLCAIPLRHRRCDTFRTPQSRIWRPEPHTAVADPENAEVWWPHEGWTAAAADGRRGASPVAREGVADGYSFGSSPP